MIQVSCSALPESKLHSSQSVLGVVSATVNVITELSRKSNPQNFLPLAPVLFELLTTSSNNWMLIKIIKLVRIKFIVCPYEANVYASSLLL
jgi:AP-3 complex subunit delta-1